MMKRDCHVDGKYLFNVGSARIHAGGMSTSYTPFQLVLNLTGRSHQEPCITGTGDAEVICKTFLEQTIIETVPELLFDWPDRGILYYDEIVWKSLVKDLSSFKGNVLVHCAGGHGRTGTLLALLYYYSHRKPLDIVKWLREQYCKKAVESEAQFNYLKACGIKTSEEPEKLIVYANSHYFAHSHFEDATAKCLTCNKDKDIRAFYETRDDNTGTCWACRAQSHGWSK